MPSSPHDIGSTSNHDAELNIEPSAGQKSRWPLRTGPSFKLFPLFPVRLRELTWERTPAFKNYRRNATSLRLFSTFSKCPRAIAPGNHLPSRDITTSFFPPSFVAPLAQGVTSSGLFIRAMFVFGSSNGWRGGSCPEAICRSTGKIRLLGSMTLKKP